MIGFPGPPAVPPALPTEMDENRPVKDPEKSLGNRIRKVIQFFAGILKRLRGG